MKSEKANVEHSTSNVQHRTGEQLSPTQLTAEKLLAALRYLTANHVPARCGGFTLDDMKLAARMPFADDTETYDALDELLDSKLAAFAGEDGELLCYKLTEKGVAS